MLTPDKITAMVNKAVEELPFTRQPHTLYEPVVYALSRGGKRIRPTLMLLAYNLFRDDPERILSQACAIEVYHNYTLLHDDLMDNADIRRGAPTVHRKWSANAAILSGDAMLVVAYRLMASCGDDTLRDVLALFSETALEIGEGQQYDMDFETRDDVTEEEYIEMIRLKTSVLLACSMKTGAILAGAPQSDADCLYKCGESLGLAFQLQDDLLDVYGDPKVFGKAVGGDIVANKKTYMLINALLRADDAGRAELVGWLSDNAPEHHEAKIAAVTRIYDALSIRELCEEKIKSCFGQSAMYMDRVSVPDSRKAPLRSFAAKMMGRER